MIQEKDRKPLVIGVTGHLQIRQEDRETLYKAVERELKALAEDLGIRMLNSLAAGADLLCADAAEALGLPLTAVLPLDAEEYRKDFGPEDLARLEHHLGRAEEVLTAPACEAEPAGTDRDFRYRQAGLWVADHCDMLLALWDGKTEDQSACGTAAVANRALRNGKTVIHVMTPRGDMKNPAGEAVRLRGREIEK